MKTPANNDLLTWQHITASKTFVSCGVKPYSSKMRYNNNKTIRKRNEYRIIIKYSTRLKKNQGHRMRAFKRLSFLQRLANKTVY